LWMVDIGSIQSFWSTNHDLVCGWWKLEGGTRCRTSTQQQMFLSITWLFLGLSRLQLSTLWRVLGKNHLLENVLDLKSGGSISHSAMLNNENLPNTL
jgi:hypothetical protein